MKIDPLIISLMSGAVGGNIAGHRFKNKSLGVIGNSLAGIAGGGIVGSAMAGWVGGSTGNAMASLISNIVGSAIGGGILIPIYALGNEISRRIISRHRRPRN